MPIESRVGQGASLGTLVSLVLVKSWHQRIAFEESPLPVWSDRGPLLSGRKDCDAMVM